MAFPDFYFHFVQQGTVFKDCSFQVICGILEVPYYISNAAGNATEIPTDDSIPSALTASPMGNYFLADVDLS